MKRREFIAGLGAGALSWPFAAQAQQPAMPVIGFLRSTTLADSMPFVSAFRSSLMETGFIEGQNVTVAYSGADNRVDRLPALIAELLRRPVAMIVGNDPVAVAAKAATTTVPIVFVTGSDAVRDGLVASLNRPGGNVTGVNFFAGVLGAKRLELLRQLVPKAGVIGVLVNSYSSETEAESKDVQAAARDIGQQLHTINVNNESHFEAAFATFVERGVGAVFIGSGPFTFSHRQKLVALAARYKLPMAFSQREAAESGGLMSYGTSRTDAYRQAGIYAGRILKGEKPAELPVIRSTKFELVINMKTAKALGMDVPLALQVAADEVIE